MGLEKRGGMLRGRWEVPEDSLGASPGPEVPASCPSVEGPAWADSLTPSRNCYWGQAFRSAGRSKEGK